MATYPAGFRTFTTKRDFTQDIIESHVNDIQTELAAAQLVLGLNPHIAERDPGQRVVNHGTVGARLQTYLRGDHQLYYQGCVVGYPLQPGNTTVPPPPTPVPPQQPRGDRTCPEHERGQRWYLPVHSRNHAASGMNGSGVFTPSSVIDFLAPTGRWTADRDDGTWSFRPGSDWDDDDHYCGLPAVDNPATTDDGRWWRLPISGTDDPYTMGVGDGIILPDTGVWVISLRVDGLPSPATTAAKAIRRARLEINGADATLRHRLRETGDNADHLHNVVHWTEVLPRGTIITASARVDGPGLTAPVPVTAYLRARMVRCVDGPPTGGQLADAPGPVRTPAPPPPVTPNRPDPPRGSYDSPPSSSSNGNYAYEMPPGSGHWVGQYSNGTVATANLPSYQTPSFVLIGSMFP